MTTLRWLGKLPNLFAKIQNIVEQKANLDIWCQLIEFVINQSTINLKSGQSVLAIHDSHEISEDDIMTYHFYYLPITSNDFELR